MSPYDPNTGISELLMMARVWVRHRAEEHAGRQDSLTRAYVIAETEFKATPDLSKSSYEMLCKRFKAQYRNCEQEDWYRRFRAQFEAIYHDRRVAQARAEDERREQARIRGEARIAHLQSKVEKSKEEESETFKEVFPSSTRHPGQASSSGDHQGAFPAEPAGSGEPSQASRGDQIPASPPRTAQNVCVVCHDRVHKHSICAFCRRCHCERHRYKTQCCDTWKCSV